MTFPFLITDNKKINTAYRLAVATLTANVLPFKDGILEDEQPVIIAGLGYVSPWTRDAAINTWNAGGLVCPDVALNTLKSVLIPYKDGYRIGGEYWDAIIWVTGAWYYYLYTGDTEFLKLAHNATENSLEYFENTEFNTELNLFRGPACYGDGISAYPDVYAQNTGSSIANFAVLHKDLCCEKGVGIPIYALSTNCLYYYAYVFADKMANVLGLNDKKYQAKAEDMKKSINKHFWSEEKQNYKYIVDEFGGCDSEEGIGISFAILFDVADDEKKKKIFKNTHVTPNGITCVWPTFKRYKITPDSYGRHSGTVWPHIQGFWADAAAKSGQSEIFDNEFTFETENALRYMQFAEIYHPETGEIYGGVQEYGSTRPETHKGIVSWEAVPYQTWSATAYLRNVYFNLVGMNFTENGITFNPVGSSLSDNITLKNIVYRNSILNITVKGNGKKIADFRLNGTSTDNFISADIKGTNDIEITLI